MSANRLLGLRCKGSKIFWIEQIEIVFLLFLES